MSAKLKTVVGAGLVALVASSMAFVAWPSTLRLRNECAQGVASACERACARDVFGDDGCLHAAALGADAGDAGAISLFFERACVGGVLDGCLGWQRSQPERPPSTSSAEYLAWLTPTRRACDLGDAVSCKRIVSATLGVDTKLARSALPKACADAEDRRKESACVERGEERLEAIEAQIPRCAQDDVHACESLALIALDGGGTAVVGEVLAKACALRGLDVLEREPPQCGTDERLRFHFPTLDAGNTDLCARELALELLRREAPPRLDDDASDASVEPTPRVELIELTPPELAPALRASLDPQLTALGQCYVHALPRAYPTGRIAHGPSVFKVRLDVDRVGDVWEVINIGPRTEMLIEMNGCVLDRVRALRIQPPPTQLARATATVRFSLR